jgi:hypothetical protein
MPIKQIKQKFQISSYDGISTNVTVTANSNVVFSGDLAETTPLISFGTIYPNSSPYAEIIFNIDVPILFNEDDPVTPDISLPMEITCTGGDVALQESLSNFTGVGVDRAPADAEIILVDGNGDPLPFSHGLASIVLGNSTDYYTCPINSIPLLNGKQDPRYGTNSNPDTYILLVKHGETTKFSISVDRFNDSVYSYTVGAKFNDYYP